MMSKNAGQETKSVEWIKQGRPDPNLIYSNVSLINMHDPRSGWALWVGYPNDHFMNSSEMKVVKNFKMAWFSFIAIGTALALLVWYLIVRTFYLAHINYETTLKAAEETIRVKTDFFANMSHELRTPLNSVIGFIQIMEQEKKLDQDHLETFGDIRRSAETLLGIVNDILDFSKIEAGEIALEYIGFDVCQKIRHTVQSMKPLASKKGLVLSHKMDRDELLVNGDPLRFARILTNLVSNAIRYTDHGNVSVYVHVTHPLPDRAILRCEVTDTGIGIPDSAKGKIFQKFSQADASTTRRYGGTGLGLAITKELVELLDGQIGFESEVGVGSTFWFEIPFETIAELTIEDRAIGGDLPFIGVGRPIEEVRVLVAEDHKMNQKFMRKLFENLGIIHYAIVENGKEAVKAVQEKTYDVVLMDCHMPEMNGYDATVAIRALANPLKKDIPIIGVTANAMPEDEKKCRALGMSGYISKPVDLSVFKKVMSQWIDFSSPADAAPVVGVPLNDTKAAPVNLSNLAANSMGDDEFFKDMIDLFVTQAATQIEELKALCTDGENLDWVEISHALKGTAGSVGAEKMRLLCAEAQEMRRATAQDRNDIVNGITAQYMIARNYLIDKGLTRITS